MKPRTVEIEIESAVCAYVRGRAAHDLLIELRGRRPMWSSIRKAYVVQEHTARDLAALAQVRRMEVIVTAAEPEPVPETIPAAAEVVTVETEAGLW